MLSTKMSTSILMKDNSNTALLTPIHMQKSLHCTSLVNQNMTKPAMKFIHWSKIGTVFTLRRMKNEHHAKILYVFYCYRKHLWQYRKENVGKLRICDFSVSFYACCKHCQRNSEMPYADSCILISKTIERNRNKFGY